MGIPDKRLRNGEILKFINYHHANQPTIDKSIWTINNANLVEEYLVEDIIDNHYLRQDTTKSIGFNVYKQNDKLSVLGKDLKTDKLYISKFINNQSTWHGYPVNHQGNNEDKPSQDILNALRENGKIDNTEMKRIKRGRPL